MKDKDRHSSILNALALSARSSKDTPDDTPETSLDDEPFAAFIDGTLDETDAARVRAHIASNPEAWIAYQALKETESIDGPPVPAHLIRAAKDLVKGPSRAANLVVRLLKGALELLDLKGLELNSPPSTAAEPVRSAAASAARQGAERIEITSSVQGIEGISLQKIEPSDVRITLEPTRDADDTDGRTVGRTLRVDLMQDDTLIQSWPLEADTLSLEPVTIGCYTLRVFEHDTRCGAAPTEIGTISIELQ